MQYKIPVQIENEDPIVFWLSLRQLIIIMVWWGFGYSLFKSLVPSLWVEVAAIPWIAILLFAIIVAVFKYSWMTFIPFILAFIRLKINFQERKWIKWVDSFQPLDIWFLTNSDWKKEEQIDFSDKIDKIKELDEKLNKI